jgi:outer membrane protein OmpA-like peptidoglycan-associated protein
VKKSTKVVIGVVSVLGLALTGWLAYKWLFEEKDVQEPEPESEQQKTLRDAMKNISFDFNTDVIRPTSFPYLNEVAAMMNNEPNLLLSVEGHTDNVGDANYNLNLSKKRALAVRSYLVNTGRVNHTRISSDGYGFTKPIADNTTEEGRSLNRRVELIITNA